MKKFAGLFSFMLVIFVLGLGVAAYAGSNGAQCPPGKKGMCKTNFGPKKKHATAAVSKAAAPAQTATS